MHASLDLNFRYKIIKMKNEDSSNVNNAAKISITPSNIEDFDNTFVNNFKTSHSYELYSCVIVYSKRIKISNYT